MKPISFNWQNGGGYGEANEGLGICEDYASPLSRSQVQAVAHSDHTHMMYVRRLTPRECERLQGFPDDHTLVPFNGGPAKDAPRYKAIGNSWAVPVVRWIGERIEKALL